MIPEEKNPKVHHMTMKGARNALAHRLISRDSYRSVLRGELSLADAKSLGRDRGPEIPGPNSGQDEGRKTPQDGLTPRPCMCSCGMTKGGRFLPGHDAKLRSELMAQIKKGDVLLRSERFTDSQRRYAVERRLVSPKCCPRRNVMARQRRGNGEGGVSRRKDGSWMARYTVQTPTGRKRKVIYAKSQAEARRKLTEAIADRDRGLTYDAEGLTVEGYLARWLEDSVRGSVKATTYQSYGSLVRNHVCPTLGSTKLSALTPAHVQGLYRQKLDEGLAPKTVKYIHTTLHRALRQAVRWGLVPRNAAAEADPPKVSTPEMRPLSPT
jgi:Phage integrase, N-terminal SAM-like domain